VLRRRLSLLPVVPGAVTDHSPSLAAARPRGVASAAVGGRRRRAPLARAAGLAVLVLYAAMAVFYEGRYAIGNLAGGTVGSGPDVQIYVWGMRWWPYALGHGLYPFVAHVLWPPYGSNVLWTTTVPALSLLFAPVTLAFGPTVAFNVASLLAPAVSAWAAYALCHELTGQRWPSIAGGAVFGFSSYELAEGLAHLHLSAAMLVPLAVLVTIRFVRGRYAGWGLALALCVIAVVQFFIAPEVLATMILMGAITWLAALAFVPGARDALLRALPWIGAALAGTAVLLAPALISMKSSDRLQLINVPATYSADLVNFVVPTRVTLLGRGHAASIAHQFIGNAAEESAYLGVPLLLLIACFALLQRGRPAARVVLAGFAAAVLFSLGPRLHVAGHASVWLPGSVLFGLPLMHNAMPVRLTLYASLAAGVMVAMMLARPPGRRPSAWRWAWVAVCLAALFPARTAALWWRQTPPAIAHGVLARAIPAGSTVISLPFGDARDRGLYAQAAANMRFKLVDRWMQVVPPQYAAFDRWGAFYTGQLSARRAAAFKRELCAFHIEYALGWWRGKPWWWYLDTLHLHADVVDGLWIYRLPRCGSA
jgi:hypothetical protein